MPSQYRVLFIIHYHYQQNTSLGIELPFRSDIHTPVSTLQSNMSSSRDRQDDHGCHSKGE
jgi:hypothetical protein